jgi:hypothetical protein
MSAPTTAEHVRMSHSTDQKIYGSGGRLSPTERVPEVLHLAVKWPGHYDDHSRSSRAEVRT